jgi:ATP-dependent DNA helicase RecG
VLVQAKLLRAEVAYRPRRQLVVHCEGLALRFFNFWGSQLKQFQREAEKGRWVRAFGEVRAGFFGSEMAHPRYKFVDPGEPLPDRLTPIYPTTAGLPQERLRARVLDALDSGELDDTLPERLRARYGLEPFAASAQLLHRPPPGADLALLAGRTHPAWRRMKFDELLAQQLSMKLAYAKRRARAAPALPSNGPLVRAFMRELPFRLTGAQTRALNEVLRDLGEPHPMQRLLQGDVGSGKTIVAAIACLAAVDAEEGAQGDARCADRDRHARAHPGGRGAAAPRPGGGRRAAPLRREAAPRPEAQGRGGLSPPAHDERDADPAHPVHDGVRRPRRLGHRRAAAGQKAGEHAAVRRRAP